MCSGRQPTATHSRIYMIRNEQEQCWVCGIAEMGLTALVITFKTGWGPRYHMTDSTIGSKISVPRSWLADCSEYPTFSHCEAIIARRDSL